MLIVETDCFFPLPLVAHPTKTLGARYAQAMELSLEYIRSLAAARFKSCGTIIGNGPFKRPDSETERNDQAKAIAECWGKPHIARKVTQDGITCTISEWAYDLGKFSPDSTRTRHIQHRVNQ